MPTGTPRSVKPALPRRDRSRVHFSRMIPHPGVLRVVILGPRGGWKGFAYADGQELVKALAEFGFVAEEQSKG